MKSLIFALVAIGVMAGSARVVAFEYDNDRSTRDAKVFYEKLDAERGN